VIDEVVKWLTRYVLGAEQSPTINPTLIQASAYVALAGGTVLLLVLLSMAHGKIGRNNRRSVARRSTDRKTLLKIGLTAMLLAGSVSPFLAIVFVFTLGLVTPLFFTNFIAALFLSNSMVLGLLARSKLKQRTPAFSYVRFLNESIKTPSFKVNASLGTIGAAAFIALFSITLGNTITSTFSSATIRLISLPIYLLIFGIVFVLYESFFKGLVRPMMGDGSTRMVYSILFELVVLVSIFVLELVVITMILSLFLPYIQLGFFLLGLPFLLVLLVISIVSAEVLYATTGGWISQIIISAVTFATLTIVFSPALRF